MANDWTKNPMEIDSVESRSGVYDIKSLEWHPGAANDDLEIRDSLGNMLWKIRALAGAPHSESQAIEERRLDRRGVQGINIVTISGGKLYIHLM
ncbi:MAG: hypothetical protein K6U11_05325 [bacterium]|nr:hypothetical protein [bacterium]